MRLTFLMLRTVRTYVCGLITPSLLSVHMLSVNLVQYLFFSHCTHIICITDLQDHTITRSHDHTITMYVRMYAFCLIADRTTGGTSDDLYLLCLLAIVLVGAAVFVAIGWCVWRKRKPARVGCQEDGKTAFYHAVQ